MSSKYVVLTKSGLQKLIQDIKSLVTKDGDYIDLSNFTVLTSAWVADTTYSYAGYGYKADISVSKAKANMIPELILTPANDLDVIASWAGISDGKVTLYATEIPEQDIVVNRISLRSNKNALSTEGKADLFNFTIDTSSWVADTTYSYAGYNYKVNVTISGATSDMIPEVMLVPSSDYDMISPFALVSNGFISLYASEVPSTSVSVNRISLRKVVNG